MRLIYKTFNILVRADKIDPSEVIKFAKKAHCSVVSVVYGQQCLLLSAQNVKHIYAKIC